MRYKIIRKSLRRLGLDLTPYPNGTLRRKIELLNLHNINLILDVGASDGSFAQQIRSIGFKGNIISFEPISYTFLKLKKKSRFDENWTALNMALGDTDSEKVINISENYDSSSFLALKDSHLIANPTSKFKAIEKVSVKKLDSIYNEYVSPRNNVLLKLDVQGFELEVLQGSNQSLKQIKGIQIEMSFEQLYKGSLMFEEMKKWLENKGYTLCLLESGNRNFTTGKLLQADGTFYRI